MNLVAHIAVARRQSNDPSFWLGAALPDLAHEAALSVGTSWPTSVLAGIACHHEVDAIFHDLPVFLTQSRALTRAASNAGLNRGAARAIGHAGWEFLLDGALLNDAALVDGYLAAMAVPVDDPGWARALERRVARGAPTFYGEPSHVAELLWRILSYRRLLAFDRDQIDVVTNCLVAAQPAVVAAVDEVFAAMPTGD